jgi:hypothetical protein
MPHAFESPQHGRHPERSFGILKRRDRLSPKRRERRLDITGYIEGLLLSLGCFPSASIPPWYAEEGASISINRLQRTRYRAPLSRGVRHQKFAILVCSYCI